MKNTVLFNIFFLSIFFTNTYSQENRLSSADTKYDKFAYVNSIKTYEKVANKGYKSVDLFQKLGNSYYFNGELPQAAKWYEELFNLGSNYDPEYYYRYAQCLRSVEQYEKADKILLDFSKIAKNDSRAKLFLENENYLDRIKSNSGRYEIEKTAINSIYSDYGTTVYLNKLIFASARDTGSVGQRKHSWTNQHFTNLYSADLGSDFNPNKVQRFNTDIKSKFNESTPVFTKDGKTVYFTRNNYLDGKKGKNDHGVTLIKIYRASLIDDKWKNIIELPFNSNEYSTAHPALSSDDKTLYFASDMPGTLGQSDLFKVSIKPNDAFGTPENLGSRVNTAGRETFPFISEANELYFASDGHPGLGGLDVFVSKINDDGTYGRIDNVGSDINSPMDDFSYWVDTKSNYGFFSSNKEGGKGYDDIYKFKELKKIVCEQTLSGIITDAISSEILPNSKVSLYDEQYQLIETVTANEVAKYSFNVLCGEKYYVRASKENYFTKEVKVTINEENGVTDLPISLEPSVKKVKVGDDLALVLEIPVIYFDLDKSNIRIDAALELEKVLDVLEENPDMKIDIRSHTDSRASKKYNEKLSDKRANSTMEWLINKGIKAERMTSKGYGESQLINKCSDDVKCTEEEHQLNRRSEFIIMAL